MAERLKSRGFRTGGFVGAYVLDHKWGVAQGFEKYFDNFDLSKYRSVSLSSVERRGQRGRRSQRSSGSTRVGSSKFFAWVHFYDAHSPYDPPEPYKSRYAGSPVRRRNRLRGLAGRPPARLARRPPAAREDDRRRHRRSRREPGRSRRRHARLLRLRERAARAAADHGRRTTRCGAGRVSDVVRTVDVLPTVLDLLGIPPSEQFEGQSLTLADDRRQQRARTRGVRRGGVPALPLRLERPADAAERAATSTSRRRGRSSTTSRRTRSEIHQHLSAAPRARRPDERAPAQSGAAPLGQRAASARAPAEIDPDTRDRLASLGYVGTFVVGRRPSALELADPKDKIELFNLITHARDLSRHDKDSDEAIRSLLEVTRQDPERHRRLVHARQRVLPQAAVHAGDRQLQAGARAEIRLRPRRHQHGQRLPPARQGRRGARRLSAVHGSSIRRTRRFATRPRRSCSIVGKLAEARAQLQEALETAAVDGRGAQRARRHRAEDRRRRAGGTRDSVGDRSQSRRPPRPLQSGAARRAARRPQRGGRRVQARDRALSRPATRPNSIWDGSTSRLAMSRRSSRPTRRRSRSIRASPKGISSWRSCIST